jgi:beta-galactosidase
MRPIFLSYFILVSFGMQAQKSHNSDSPAVRTVSFDKNWLFRKDSTVNTTLEQYDDSNWRKVDLPHDWSVEDLPDQIPDSITGPFSKASIGGTSTGFTVGGTGWYRKKFIMGKAEQDKRVSIHFDGAYMNTDVWLNGNHLGNHPYGYTPFYYDLTPFLNKAGSENVLLVRVRNEGKNSRWYSGSGIYRHVWLTITNPVHIAPWGVFITTPQVLQHSATINVKTVVENEQITGSNISLITTIRSPEGKVMSRSQIKLTLEAHASGTDSQIITLNQPLLWSIESPRLYNAITEISLGNLIIDRVETSFGIRNIHVDAKNGFTLNGKRVLLKGGSLHHDNGPLGAAVIDRAEERKIEILKKNGFNAIRTSHNPPSQQLLDACDRLGMLVVDEAFDMWQQGKNPDDYHLYFDDWWQKDIAAMVLRDRNHPSVIIWSIGNEIPERADSLGLRSTRKLRDAVHRLDPTRPVTEALCEFWEPQNQGKLWKATASAFALLDLGGYNYLWQRYEPDHAQFPERIMLGTESFAKEALENWNMVEKHPYVIGDFVWTAFDYMGEASIGHTRLERDTIQKVIPTLGWPWYNAWCGDIDIIGQKKPQSYYRDVVWRRRPIAMAVHQPIPDGYNEKVSAWGWPDERQSWTWPGAEGKGLQVRVFSRARMVRLKLNGKTIGEQKIGDTSITAVFEVPYQAGTLQAVNVINGRETDAVTFKTTGTPKRIRLVADRTSIRASRNDLAYITVEVVDANNQVVPTAEVPVQFTISGAGELAAAGSANPTDLSSFRKGERNTFRGRSLAIIRPNEKWGYITLKATAPGLVPAQVRIAAR